MEPASPHLSPEALSTPHLSMAQGRLKGLAPIGVVDIGSNSVRLVVYEGLVRSPTVLFNEKILCGLGKGVAKTGRLNEAGVEQALRTLARFRVLCQQLGAVTLHVLATAAAREAENGADFITRAEAEIGAPILVLSGTKEAAFAAYGVISSFHEPQGLAGDFGGGSLELIPVRPREIGEGVSLRLGGLCLKDMADSDIATAAKIARRALRQNALIKASKGDIFYAVGGTWRNIAKLHMVVKHYPLPVMHHYEVNPTELSAFLQRIVKGDVDTLRGIGSISKNRRQLLPYGATVLNELIHVMHPSRIIFSGAGMREGYLYDQLPENIRHEDALLAAAKEMAILRSRSPEHAQELTHWTADAFAALDIAETLDERRYREAACYLSDIAWRISSDYRGIEAASQIAFGLYNGIDHGGRLFAALAIFFRNQGLVDDRQAPDIIHLASEHIRARARLLGAIMRLSNIFCASTAGILPHLRWKKMNNKPTLEVPEAYAALIGERSHGRMQHLAQLVGQDITFTITG